MKSVSMKSFFAALTAMLGFGSKRSKVGGGSYNQPWHIQTARKRDFKKKDKFDYQFYCSPGYGWFKSRQTGKLVRKPISGRNLSDYAKKFYGVTR